MKMILSIVHPVVIVAAALAADAPRADRIPDECRPKAWWFFGQTETTHEGITADAEAMKRVGFGGVVYYDQYHGENPNAEKLWSDEWWDVIEFAASEAARLGITFETAVGSGYVAGGSWIDPAHAMKTLAVIDRDTNGGKVTLPLPVAKDRGWQKTVAVLAIPLPDTDAKFVDMEYAGHEKGLASTMQHPGGMYGYREKTFKAVTNSLPKIPRWQAKTAAVVDFVPRGDTPVCIDPKTIRDVTEKFDESDRRLKCELPAGRWNVLRFVAVPTGGRTKHGRPEAMGLECDKMSVAAAELHWNAYTKRIIDRLKSKRLPLAGIILDSHEAGAQNWTDDMLREFARRRGYDFRPYLPLMAGYCVAPNAEDVLADFRRTCVELIAERYYGTFDRLCREEGLSFTGQAGGGMFMIADSVFSKKYISIPEGEFWGYQKHGAYDVKDTSSAAHLYGKKIASAEAMTDAPYKMTIPELRRRCDLAFAFGANSMTVCAVPHLPKKDCGVKAPTGPREYGLNRSNPWWEGSRPFWDYIAFCSWMLRQGEPAPEALFYAGDDVPVKIIASKVPKALGGLDWDFATGDAAARMTKTAEAWTTPEGIRYGYVVDSEGRTLAGTPPARRLNLPHISRLLPSGEKLAFIANDTEHEVKVDLGGESAVVIDPWTRCRTTESSVVIPPGESRFVKGASAADPVQKCERDGTSRVIRNGSFDADRRQIPIRHKPDPEGWQRHEESVCVTNGTHVVEFVATAPCRIDDVSLIAAQAGAGLPNEIVAGEKLHGGFTLVPVKCHPGAAQPFRPFFKSYDDSGVKVSANQVASPCETALREGFANPPPDVKIGCYYYWVNERVDKEGVRKDLQWMKENGITRAFLATDIRNRTRFENPWEGQQFGDCSFRSEKWWRCLRTAFRTAGELGIEMGIFNCPGWSQSGGPWVTKEDAQIAPDGSRPKNGPCSPKATGYEVSKTNRAAVRRHFDAFIGEILRRIPKEERQTLTTVVVDSWERGRVVKPEGDPRKLSDIIAEEYMGELTRCAHANGLITWCEPYTHSREGWDASGVTYGAAADEVAAEFWASGRDRVQEMRNALGAARASGKNKIYAESFTSGDWKKHAKDDWSFDSLKWVADKFLHQGVNATILHVVISQPGDESEPPVRPWFGTFFDRRSKNAAETKKLVEYCRRCNFMLQQGKPFEGRPDERILDDGARAMRRRWPSAAMPAPPTERRPRCWTASTNASSCGRSLPRAPPTRGRCAPGSARSRSPVRSSAATICARCRRFTRRGKRGFACPRTAGGGRVARSSISGRSRMRRRST